MFKFLRSLFPSKEQSLVLVQAAPIKPAKRETTIVDIRRLETPVIYKTREVLYDAWGDPYVKFGNHVDRNCALRPNGRVSDGLYDTEWRINSGPPVTFSNFNPSTGWHPNEAATIARSK
jgi:hypothetical protein